MRGLLGLAAVITTVALLWEERAKRPGGSSSPSSVTTTARSVPAGPVARGLKQSRAIITVQRGPSQWELRGALDLSEGYRFRGHIVQGGVSFRRNGTPIWLAGGNGAWGRRPAGYYDTLTKLSSRREKPVWLDDHPPTLPFSRTPFDQEDGAEVYAHLALLTLKHGTFGTSLDLGRYVRRPPGFNELRKAALSAGPTVLDATVDAADRLQRLKLEFPPATVAVRLFPSTHQVPELKLRRLAVE